MCGFVAIFSPRPTEAAVISEMSSRLWHRGPDDSGLWQKNYGRYGSVSLGFRRLAILDKRSEANQPMVSQDSKKVMVFNGEIYNYVELRETLEGLGSVFKTTGDSEVLLHAYERWGREMLPRLNGMFSFVIWDEEYREAFIARDRFGEKPLFFYRFKNGGIAFSSEIKAFFAHPSIDCAPNYQAIQRVLSGKPIFSSEETVFAGVSQYKAAHKAVVSGSGELKSTERYWSPTYGRNLESFSKKKVCETFREHLFRSIKMRIRSDVPLTASLSGGLDSSSLVAALAQLGKQQEIDIDRVISVRFDDDPTISEGSFIDSVLSKTGLEGISVSPNVESIPGELRKMHWHHETVIPGVSMYLEWCIMKAAKSNGYTTIIDGQGADEILAGYRSYFQAYQFDVASDFGQNVLNPSINALREAIALGEQRDKRLQRETLKYANASRRFSPTDSLTQSELESNYGQRREEWMRNVFDYQDISSPSEIGALRYELAINLLEVSLPSNLYSGDRNSMAHSIECRYPFLDYELVDFCLQLPDWAYIYKAWQKYILRRAMKSNLPKRVLWRVDKMGFAGPQDEWLRSPGLSLWLKERLLDTDLSAVGLSDKNHVQRLFTEHQDRSNDHSGLLWQWASASELLAMFQTGDWKHGLDCTEG